MPAMPETPQRTAKGRNARNRGGVFTEEQQQASLQDSGHGVPCAV